MNPENGHPEPGLVMPFVVCASTGGPYEDEAFCAGYEAGRIASALNQHPSLLTVTVRTASAPQLDLIAMSAGFVMATERCAGDDHWVIATFIRSDDLDFERTKAGA